jgi:hypothetical protein
MQSGRRVLEAIKNMLYFIFTIDGDWDEYFNIKLSPQERKPDEKRLLSLIDEEIDLALAVLNGKFLHFIHTSPLARDFFLQPRFIAKWREIARKGGSLGIHCHEEELYSAWYFDDAERMEAAITFMANGLRKNGLLTIAYRGGFMAFSSKLIPILEKKDIFLDFSCESGRHLKYGDVLVSDWRGAPDNYYCMSSEDHRKSGKSHVFEIPLGIYIEKQSLWSIWKKARMLGKREGKQVLSVLAHLYDFKKPLMCLKIKLALLILRKYGRFVNAEEALDLIRKGGF